MKRLPLSVKQRQLRFAWLIILFYAAAAMVVGIASLGLDIPKFDLTPSQATLGKWTAAIFQSQRPSAFPQPSQPGTEAPALTPIAPRQAAIPSRFQGKIVRQVAVNNRKVAALTFDDGPWPLTPKFLEILQREKVPSTFFVIGRHLKRFPEIAKQVTLAGHAIGNHSWSHRFSYIDTKDIRAEIENTSALINKITGIKTDLFRPPGGFLDNGLSAYASGKNYLTAMWTVDPHDTQKGMQSKAIVEHVLKNAQPGSIILLHDGGGPRQATLAALPQIIAGLRAKGYEFATLPELLQLQVAPTPPPSATAPTAKPTPTKSN